MIGGISIIYMVPMIIGSLLGIVGTLITARLQARAQARQRSGNPGAADIDRLWQEMREGPRWLMGEFRIEIDRQKQEILGLRQEVATMRHELSIMNTKLAHYERVLEQNGVAKEQWGG